MVTIDNTLAGWLASVPPPSQPCMAQGRGSSNSLLSPPAVPPVCRCTSCPRTACTPPTLAATRSRWVGGLAGWRVV